LSSIGYPTLNPKSLANLEDINLFIFQVKNILKYFFINLKQKNIESSRILPMTSGFYQPHNRRDRTNQWLVGWFVRPSIGGW
jgi:hypothetical protein